MKTLVRHALPFALLALVACASAPKPRELEAFEAIKNQQTTYQAALKRAPQLVSEAEALLTRSREAWQSKDLEESRRDALMGQTKLKTAYALVEQDAAKARMETADKRFRATEDEYARVAKDLAQTNETVVVLRKLKDANITAAADRERMTKQLMEEQRRISDERDRGQAQQKLAAAELALKNADAVNAATYAAVDYGAAKDMVARAQMELKANNFAGASTSAELAKGKAEQALSVAKPEFEKKEAGRDLKAKSQELSADAASLPGTAVRIDRKGEVQRLILPYGKLFAGKLTTMKPGSDASLDAVAQLLKKHVSYPVQVVGHTDSRGKRDALLALSMARAQAVYNALVSRGVDAKRMTATGMGGDEPVTDNKSPAGRATNNRVEIVLIIQ